MTNPTPALKRMRAICLALPDTKETLTWGQPHFRVGEKIFGGYGDEDGRPVIGFKLTMEHAAQAVDTGRFFPAKYVGHKGWVSAEAEFVRDWDEIARMVLESYTLIAPARSKAKLAEPQAETKAKAESKAKKSPARKRAKQARPARKA
jgi:predicted DNA-binding protein (MmcQ/YjbR family)